MRLHWTKITAGAVLASALLISACKSETKTAPETPATLTSDANLPVLVQPDGSYPTVPLAKDVIVLKVLQTTVKSLQDYPSVEEGLTANLAHMKAMADEACSTGKKPDILLYHEFPYFR